MSNEDIEKKIIETRNKITHETKMFLALLKMYKMKTDKHQLQQCENQIQEYTERLKFLKSEYEKLLKNKDVNTTIENQLTESGNLTTEKIAYRMRKIHEKLLIEIKLKEGLERAVDVMNTNSVSESSNQYIETKTKVKENGYKILCLNNAMKKYKSLYLGPPIDFSDEKSEDNKSKGTNNSHSHSSQNGSLQIKIISASKLNTLSDDMNLRVIISVNGHQFANTSSNKYGRWNEFFDISADKDSEVEIMVKEDSTSVVGLVWFKPSELKKEIMNDIGEDNELYTLSLEPAGEIQLKMKYVYDKKQNGMQNGIQRRKAAHKLILNKQGHKLVSTATDSYNIFYKCATCGGFFRNGLQCVDCRYVCHTKCAPMIFC